jgi:hypothetical protein
MPWLSLSAFALSAGIAYATLLNVCGLLFQCGCRSWWTGAAAHCNIHQAHLKHCPWCTLAPEYFWGLFGAFVLAEGVAVFALRRRAFGWQLSGALGAYLASAAASALVLGFSQHYWD